MTAEHAGYIGAFLGMAFSYALLRGYIAHVKTERQQDAYEEGWAQGYEIGLQAGKPKRVRKPRKAEDA